MNEFARIMDEINAILFPVGFIFLFVSFIALFVFLLQINKENDRLRDRIKAYQKCTKDLRNKLELRPQDYTYLCDYKGNCANKILGFDADECLSCAYLQIEKNKSADEAPKGGADHD